MSEYIKSMVAATGSSVHVMPLSDLQGLQSAAGIKLEEGATVAWVKTGPLVNADLTYEHLTKCGVRMVIINTEQATRADHPKIIRFALRPGVSLIDYSRVNRDMIVKNNPGLNQTVVMPYFVNHPAEDSSDVPKTKSVAFIGASSARRRRVLSVVSGTVGGGDQFTWIKAFGAARDAQLWKHRVLVNIHHADSWTIFEEIRCNRCVFNQMIVVSEESQLDPEHPIRRYVVFAPLDRISATVRHVVDNYEDVHKKLFPADFSAERLQQELKLYSDSTMNNNQVHRKWVTSLDRNEQI